MTEEQKQKKSEYNKKYWAEHKDEIAAKRKAKAARDKYNARQRERYATDPEFRAKVKAWTNKWRTSPKGRAKFNARMREYMKTYSKTEKYRARVKAYYSRPEVKARYAAYAKGYAAGIRKAKADFMKNITTRVIHEFTKG